MGSSDLEWIVITVGAGREIGAVGLLDGKVAVITAFFDSRDGDMDGEVDAMEALVGMLSPFSLDGKAVAEVALAAKYDIEVLSRDPSFASEANRIWFGFTRGTIADGMYTTWFSRGVKTVAGEVAQKISGNVVKQFVIRKGMEKAVKTAYKYAR